MKGTDNLEIFRTGGTTNASQRIVYESVPKTSGWSNLYADKRVANPQLRRPRLRLYPLTINVLAGIKEKMQMTTMARLYSSKFFLSFFLS
jgi:hypothetical protein